MGVNDVGSEKRPSVVVGVTEIGPGADVALGLVTAAPVALGRWFDGELVLEIFDIHHHDLMSITR